MTPEVFRDVLSHYPTGVTIITAMDENGPAGMTVGTFTSASLHPSLVGFLPAKSSMTWPRLRDIGRICVNVMAQGQDEAVRAFSRSGVDKFTGLDWTLGSQGAPMLRGAVAWIDCEITQVTEVGDHDFVLARPVKMTADDSAVPMIFYRGRFAGVDAPTMAGAN